MNLIKSENLILKIKIKRIRYKYFVYLKRYVIYRNLLWHKSNSVFNFKNKVKIVNFYIYCIENFYYTIL